MTSFLFLFIILSYLFLFLFIFGYIGFRSRFSSLSSRLPRSFWRPLGVSSGFHFDFWQVDPLICFFTPERAQFCSDAPPNSKSCPHALALGVRSFFVTGGQVLLKAQLPKKKSRAACAVADAATPCERGGVRTVPLCSCASPISPWR